jgi:hypothetical protein
MKRLTFALGLVVATALAAPLEAQSRNDGPWWDPANTGGRSGNDSRVDDRRDDRRDGRIYNDGRVYDSRRADGRWHAEGRDRSGNIIYVRTRYDRNGNLIREVARRDRLGRYNVIQRRVIQSANRRHDRNNDGWYDNRDRNDRWDQNNGHDNGRHNGKYKNKNKNKGRR